VKDIVIIVVLFHGENKSKSRLFERQKEFSLAPCRRWWYRKL